MDWTLAHTDARSKAFMAGLPFDLRFSLGARRVRLVHGSPRKVNEYLFEDKPASLYERLAPQADCDVLVFGHTHKPWVREYGGVLFVNCGSVGKPKDGDPRGAFAVLEDAGGELTVSIERVPYDAEGGRARRRGGRPPAGVRRQAGRGGVSARPNLPRRLAAEALGTFCLVFAGTGAIVVNAVAGNPLGHGGVAAAFGLVVAVMIFGLGHLSGAHLNPAVTVAFCSSRHFPPGEVGPYVGAQLAGAILASLSLRGLFGLAGGLGATHPDHVGDLGALALEAGLTAVLMIVVLAVATDTRAVGSMAAIAIGATIGVEALVMGPITGASMNPARSLAPALVGGDWTDLWHLPGGARSVRGLVGALIYQFLRDAREPAAAPAAIGEPQEAVR